MREATKPIRSIRARGCFWCAGRCSSGDFSGVLKARASLFKGPCGRDLHRGLLAAVPVAVAVKVPAALDARRGGAMVATESLGELGGLAVAHALGDLADRDGAFAQEARGVTHPDLREVLAETGLADLGEHSLQLAARGSDLACESVQIKVVGVLPLDHLDGLFEHGPAAVLGGGPHCFLCLHESSYRRSWDGAPHRGRITLLPRARTLSRG